MVSKSLLDSLAVQADVEGSLSQPQQMQNIIDYASVRSLTSEVRQKLADHKPETIGQAGRIPGVTPAAISLLMVHLKKSAR